MGQDLSQVIRGEQIFLGAFGLYLLAVLMPVVLFPILTVLWLICLFVSYPIMIYGGWVLVFNGVWAGVRHQPVKVTVAGIILTIWGFMLIMLGGLVNALLFPHHFWAVPPFMQPVLMGFIMYGFAQIGLGLITIVLTAPSCLRELGSRSG